LPILLEMHITVNTVCLDFLTLFLFHFITFVQSFIYVFTVYIELLFTLSLFSMNKQLLIFILVLFLLQNN